MSNTMKKLIQAVEGIHLYLDGIEEGNPVLDKVAALVREAKHEAAKVKSDPPSSSGGGNKADSSEEKQVSEKLIAYLGHGDNPAGISAWEETFVSSVGEGLLKYGALTRKQYDVLVKIWKDRTGDPLPGRNDNPLDNIEAMGESDGFDQGEIPF